MKSLTIKSKVAVTTVIALVLSAGPSLADKNTDAIAERIAPVGKICMAGDPCVNSSMPTAATTTVPAAEQPAAAVAPAGPREPEAIFNKTCVTCHNGNLPAAPKVGDATAWQPRIDKGDDALFNSVWNGLNAMPAKGMCTDCSEEEIKSTIHYIIDQVH